MSEINWSLIITSGIIEFMFLIGLLTILRAIYFMTHNTDPKEAIKIHWYHRQKARRDQQEMLDKHG